MRMQHKHLSTAGLPDGGAASVAVQVLEVVAETDAPGASYQDLLAGALTEVSQTERLAAKQAQADAAAELDALRAEVRSVASQLDGAEVLVGWPQECSRCPGVQADEVQEAQQATKEEVATLAGRVREARAEEERVQAETEATTRSYTELSSQVRSPQWSQLVLCWPALQGSVVAA